MTKKYEATLRKLSREQLEGVLSEAEQTLVGDPQNAEALEVKTFVTDLLKVPPEEAPAEVKKEQTFEEKHAALIAKKVNAGLTREGAIEVIKHQIENDAKRDAKKDKK